jgi:hypothetical protein
MGWQKVAALAAMVARIPGKADFDRIRDLSDGSARGWASDAEYLGCTLLMLIRGADVEISSALDYDSPSRGETRTILSPRSADMASRPHETGAALSGRVTDVIAWREGWAAVLEACATEIGLACEVRVFIAVDADHDTLTFQLDADGPVLPSHRDLRLAGGALSDRERGEIWYFGPAS